MASLCGQAGFIITAATEDTTTTLLTLASEHALRTFMVPVTAGASSSTCSKWLVSGEHGDAEEGYRKGKAEHPDGGEVR